MANSTPPAVSKMNATRPRPRISRVSGRRNCSACIWQAMVMPSRMVIRLASTCWAVSDRESSTPHSRMRLPNIRKPTSATDAGATSPATTVIRMGKRMRVILETLCCVIGHADHALFLGGQQADDGRLDDGHQRHIRIGGTP